MDWFETAYYDLLYNNRDETEAAVLIHQLFGLLPPEKESIFLDVACGNGRHAAIMQEYGRVYAFDLCRQKIDDAIERELTDTTFFCHDMLKPLNIPKVNYAFNLFTSFGYFTNQVDDHTAMANISHALKKDAYFIQDFLNIHHIKANIVNQEVIFKENIKFLISRKIENDFVKKTIKVTDHNQEYEFTEQVRNYDKLSLSALHSKHNLIPIHYFGNYDLSEYNEFSPRLIIISQKS